MRDLGDASSRAGLSTLATKGFLITLRSQPFHAALYAAYKNHGTMAAFSEALGLSCSNVCRWITLRDYPRAAFHTNGRAPRSSYRQKVGEALRREIGIGLDECWPLEVRQFIDRTRELKSLVFERTGEVPMERLTGDMMRRLTYEGNTERTIMQKEAQEAIEKVLKTLGYREREILKLRYGLNGGLTYTINEVAQIFKVTRERIRQVEAKAIRKLQQPSRAGQLVGFWGD